MMSLLWTGRLLTKVKVLSGVEVLVEEYSAPGLGKKPSKEI